MNESLAFLIEIARNYRMSEEEQREKVLSWAYGNLEMDGCVVSREDIAQAYDKLKENNTIDT